MNDQPGQLASSGTTPSGAPGVGHLPALDLKPADVRPLPQCFASLAMLLSDEAIAKLRAIDTTRAMVSIKPRGGAPTPFMPLAQFLSDFPSEVAAELGTGGQMLATIEPNDGRLEKFWFGFVAPGEVNTGATQGSREIAELREFVKAMAVQQQETMKLILLAGGGNGGGQASNLDIELTRFAKFAELMRAMQPPPPPAQDPAKIAEGMAAMANGMGNAMGAMLNNAKVLTEQAKALGAPPAPTFAQEVKEIMAIPGAPDLAKEIAARVLPPRGGASSSPATGEPAPGPQNNPLERVG